MEVGIYVKSHFRGNPRGTGEAAAVVEYIGRDGKSYTRTQNVSVEHDTKNALHLKICIAAMRILIKPCCITFYMDNEYMKNACLLGWMKNWKQAGWKKAGGKELANAEEWRQIYMLTQIHDVAFEAYNIRHEDALGKLLKETERGTNG